VPMPEEIRGLPAWVSFLSRVDIPVMRQTARELARAREDPRALDARRIARIVVRDPMMTAKLLRHLTQQRRRGRAGELVQIDQAVMMLGMDAFYAGIRPEPLVDDVLRGETDALARVLRVVRRAQRASTFAMDWAARLHDLHWEEVRIAALLHDLAEMLAWCFAPELMRKVYATMRRDPAARSRSTQEAIFGFALHDLQTALARAWGLPDLLLKLMDDAYADNERVRNVMLAVNLARHSADGWSDAALPDDFRAIADLLRSTPEHVIELIGAEASPASAPGNATG